jgi:hypothetical protein
MKPICTECRGAEIQCLASCEFDPVNQCWVAVEFNDDYFCVPCDMSCNVEWVEGVPT